MELILINLFKIEYNCMLKKIRRIKLRKPSVSALGRKLRGLIHSCERCGATRKELFKMHTFNDAGTQKIHYYCHGCYARILRRPKEI